LSQQQLDSLLEDAGLPYWTLVYILFPNLVKRLYGRDFFAIKNQVIIVHDKIAAKERKRK
jgi:hypothetical protein